MHFMLQYRLTVLFKLTSGVAMQINIKVHFIAFLALISLFFIYPHAFAQPTVQQHSTVARVKPMLPYHHFTAAVKLRQLKKLTPLQYYITQKGGTEKPGSGEYYNFFKPGIYVDVVSGEPLFASTDKYQADSGWPAFTKPINKNSIKIIKGRTWFGIRELKIRSAIANSHLGDLFYDRTVKDPPSDGAVKYNTNAHTFYGRYCIDSAALKFIPLAEMKKAGYAAYIPLIVGKK